MSRGYEGADDAPFKEGHVLFISSMPAMRLLVIIGMIAIASSSFAQNNPLRQFENNPRPFQETGPNLREGPPGVVTPQRLTDEIEWKARKKREESNGKPLERSSCLFIFDADNAGEFNALARYSLLLLAVLTQNSEELPLKRVYLRTVGQEIPLLKLSSWRVNVDQKLLAYTMFGPYREDGFYLFPTGAMLRTGQLQADFAASRSGLPLLELPSQLVRKWLSNIQNPDPAPDALPNLKALQRLLKRETAGFPVIDSLPQAAMAKKPMPESLPQGGEPKKPPSLKDLFKM